MKKRGATGSITVLAFLLLVSAVAVHGQYLIQQSTCGDSVCSFSESEVGDCPKDCDDSWSCSVCSKLCPVQPVSVVWSTPTLEINSSVAVRPESMTINRTEIPERGKDDPGLLEEKKRLETELKIAQQMAQELEHKIKVVDRDLQRGRVTYSVQGGEIKTTPAPLAPQEEQEPAPTDLIQQPLEPSRASLLVAYVGSATKRVFQGTGFYVMMIALIVLLVGTVGIKLRTKVIPENPFDQKAVKASMLMSSEIIAIDVSEKLIDAIAVMVDENQDVLAVTDSNLFIGELTGIGIVQAFGKKAESFEQLTVRDAMILAKSKIPPGANLTQLLDRMVQTRSFGLAIAFGKEIVGKVDLLSIADRLEYLTSLLIRNESILPTIAEVPHPFFTCNEQQTVKDACEQLGLHQASSCPILKNGTEDFLGFVTHRDILSLIYKGYRMAGGTPLTALQLRQSPQLALTTSIAECNRIFIESKIREAPIIAQGKLVGVISHSAICQRLSWQLSVISAHRAK